MKEKEKQRLEQRKLKIDEEKRALEDIKIKMVLENAQEVRNIKDK